MYAALSAKKGFERDDWPRATLLLLKIEDLMVSKGRLAKSAHLIPLVRKKAQACQGQIEQPERVEADEVKKVEVSDKTGYQIVAKLAYPESLFADNHRYWPCAVRLFQKSERLVVGTYLAI